MSSRHPIDTKSSRSYSRAYALHYSQRDLLGALTAYDHVIEQHPTSPEADYSRSQMYNIVRSVVPASTLLASEVALVRRHLQPVDGAPLADTDSPRTME